MKQKMKYIDLPWAVVALSDSECFTIDQLVNDEPLEEAVERYVIGYMSFWHIAFIERDALVPCEDEQLRHAARLKIERYIKQHPPVQTLPRFYIVLLGQPFAPLEPDGMTCVYQM